MNAPFSLPVIPAAEAPRETPRFPRFPKLTAAEIEARKAADRLFWAPIIAELGQPRFIISFPDTGRHHPVGLEWGTVQEARNVLR